MKTSRVPVDTVPDRFAGLSIDRLRIEISRKQFQKAFVASYPGDFHSQNESIPRSLIIQILANVRIVLMLQLPPRFLTWIRRLWLRTSLVVSGYTRAFTLHCLKSSHWLSHGVNKAKFLTIDVQYKKGRLRQ